ncbi:MAG: tetratricopeptide repeat protein, partial [Planctomycetes bacterium]|nr:tetratricopeptide repeat protein [Planctomycetota bacterium]
MPEVAALLSRGGTTFHRRALGQAWHVIADAYRADGEADRAEAAYHRSLAFDGRRRRVHVDLAWLVKKQGRPAEALAHLRAAVDLDPVDLNTRKWLVLAYADLGRHAETLDDLRVLVEAQPDDPVARLFLAKALRTTGRSSEAVGQYRAALRLAPGWLLAANDLAWLLATCGDDDVRDGAESVALAEAASAAGDRRQGA